MIQGFINAKFYLHKHNYIFTILFSQLLIYLVRDLASDHKENKLKSTHAMLTRGRLHMARTNDSSIFLRDGAHVST